MSKKPKRTLKKPYFHNFDGKYYEIILDKPEKKLRGWCCAPDSKIQERQIMVHPGLDRLDFVETVIHEALHAEQWYLSEETVERISVSLTKLLDKLELLKD